MCSSPPSQSKTTSLLARYTTAALLLLTLTTWCHFAFPAATATPGLTAEMHSYKVPLGLTVFYLLSLPSLKYVTDNYLAKKYDMKSLLTESMVLYNVAQVLLNGWTVYAIVDAVMNRDHPFIGSRSLVGAALHSGSSYAVWVHYCDKYLEFFDTYFMVLRGKMDQVSFLHIYHHTTIAWAWWIALRFSPGGDIYFGALLNSIIHVLMYSYYALALLKVSCPWKRYLTQAQLLQFTSVVVYTGCTGYTHYYHTKHGADETQPSLGTYYFCCGVQVFEMVSLFVLFSIFYKRSYSKKNKSGGKDSKKNDDGNNEDQCHKAMKDISEGAKEVVGHAAKDAGKLVATASKAVKRKGTRVTGAM
uniref:Elongation of fatty acids protein n=1 Tax=Thalassiosira pseudonana TaxID=35128 RepID=Q5SE75_THAPS|nr:polyunsaturated fatty acid elongase 2 [Thalassiosira pseudonana]